MKIFYCKDHKSMSLLASSMVLPEIEKKKDLLLCAATGGSPEGLYLGWLIGRIQIGDSSKI